jgi:hypothetical protein
MTYHVRVSWPNGKSNSSNFGHDLEAAARYADQAPDSVHGQTRTLVPVCDSCEEVMTSDMLPSGHMFGDLCRDCFDSVRDCDLVEAGFDVRAVAYFATLAGFEFPVWGEIND